ncbi:MAG: transcription termination/antitermination protein NusG [Proteobacteria bacterium]|nr:transcription termination/antitermination protein NusG [Pseudomonadota bacterium]
MAARWYIVHAHSGFEKKVAQSIKEQAVQNGISHQIEDVVVPVEEVTEVRRGKKVAAERKFFPGYVMVKMELNDATWHMVKNTAKVTGFLGGGGKGRPVPITDKEAEAIFAQVREGIEHPKSQIRFEVGENVKIIEGPFDSFVGQVEQVDDEKNRVKVSVSIFGRATPVDLEFSQVEKVA